MHTMLVNLSRQRRYWLMLLILGIALEAIALFYQYALDYPPCVLCIHIRILVFAFMLLAFLALFCTDSLPTMRLLHGANSLLMMGMVERSWQVLAVERGWTFGLASWIWALPPGLRSTNGGLRCLKCKPPAATPRSCFSISPPWQRPYL